MKNAQWFLDRDFHRMGHSHHPGSSRAYAWVLERGQVATGDVVVVEPNASSYAATRVVSS